MSGIAILVEGADFSQDNVGQVTFVRETVEVMGIAITGSPTVGEYEVTLGLEYTPENTTQKGVTWSVESGNATISQNGCVTVQQIGETDVVVKAVSIYDLSVFASKTLHFSTTFEWIPGFYNSTSGAYRNDVGQTSNGWRYYTLADDTPLDLTKYDYSIVAASGYKFRLVFYSGLPTEGSTKLGTIDTTTSVASVAAVMPNGAKYARINISHDDVTGPSAGTVITDAEAELLNDVLSINIIG